MTPTLSVDAVQVISIRDDEITVNVRPVGAVGFVLSMTGASVVPETGSEGSELLPLESNEATVYV